MFKKIIQDFLSLTPFISPTMDRFYKRADKDGFLSSIPAIGGILNFIPPLKWIDSKFKYPLLTIGRIIVSIIVVLTCLSFTNDNAQYKEFVNTNVTNKIIQEPELEVVPEFKVTNPVEMGANLSKNLSASIGNQFKQQQTATFRSFSNGILSSPNGVIVRAPIFYLLYSLLFFLFGNTLAQRDGKALSRISGVRKIGEEFINNIQNFIPQEKLAIINQKFQSLDNKKKIYNLEYQKELLDIIKN
jgi:hypothetical protein